MDKIRFNINKIHSNILNLFENVSVLEKSNKKFGNYFEILVNENKQVKIILTKKDVENSKFKWSYYSNPNNEDSYLIERISDVESITDDIKEIFTKNRFDKDYINK